MMKRLSATILSVNWWVPFIFQLDPFWQPDVPTSLQEIKWGFSSANFTLGVVHPMWKQGTVDSAAAFRSFNENENDSQVGEAKRLI